MKRLIAVLALVSLAAACSPTVGSPKWCTAMKEKPKGEWSANDAGDYAKSCIF